ncbi:MAG TPA: MFS transporter [Jiangellaceae bacterium]|nr:MFS transporter [Jiangellaceae bacterium]
MSVSDLALVRRHYLILAALRWFPVGLVIPVMVLLFRTRGLDLAEISILVSCYGVTTALCELPTGGLADVVGRRPVLVAAAVLFVAHALLHGLGQTLPVLAVGSIIGGLARALDSGPLQAWYVDAVHSVDPEADLKPGLSRGIAVEAAALGTGALAGGGLVSLAPLPARDAVVVSLSVPFLVSAAISVLSTAVIARWVREPARNPRPSFRGVLVQVPATVRTGVRLTARPGALRRMTLLSGCLGVTLVAVELLSPVSFAELLGGEDAAAGPYSILVTLAFFGTSVGSSAAPAIARMVRSPARGIGIATLLASVAVLGLAAPGFALAATGYVALYVLLGISGPLASDITHRAAHSNERATVLSVQSLTLQLSGVIAALVLGRLAENVSFIAAFGMVAFVLVLGALTCVGLREPARSDMALPPGVTGSAARPT